MPWILCGPGEPPERTAEDFGSQGEAPSHPDLLDWLAVEFVESGWDVKHMHRLIMTSATYLQSSRVGPELYQRDPENRLLARGPRFRMEAEEIRDLALAASGLLVERTGGPSVKPYQPPGLWEDVAYPDSDTSKFVRDEGEALDGRDQKHRPFARFCWEEKEPGGLLERIGLWMEHPGATVGMKAPWVHLQIVPPGSGARVFVPSAEWAAKLTASGLLANPFP